ncbi:MAG: transcriptional repressor LexA [Armatimonadetes bacterium]|nr:transcriptional repressor LexA [Armatimonadota bacterium]
MKGLTVKQQRVLDVIRRWMRTRGQPPTVREIGQEIGVASSCTVQRHLDALERKGFIRRNRYKYRSIELTGSPIAPFVRAVNIPVLGQIAAGAPILAQENIEDSFPLALDMAREGEEVFMLRVKGDSMIHAGIFDGDLVAVRSQPTANNGEIVVALIEDEATVKRFRREDGRILLLPENPAYEPIVADPATLRILGKVILCVRRYH